MTDKLPNHPMVRAPRGSRLNARSWQTEGPLRMLMNNLDPEVAENARTSSSSTAAWKGGANWPSFDRIVPT